MSSEQPWSFTTGVAGLADANPHTMAAAPGGAGLVPKRAFLHSLQIRNGANAGTIQIKDDAGAGTVLWASTLAANEYQLAIMERPIPGLTGNMTVTGSVTGAIVNAQGTIF